MSFNITFNGAVKTYDKPVSVLDVVGKSRDIVCAYVNNRVRELTYVIENDATVVALTVKDRDAKPTYEASVRFVVAMAMRNILPKAEIRFSYNVSRSIFLQVLTPGIVVNPQLVTKLEKEMQRIIKEDYPLVRSIVSKEEAKKVLLTMLSNLVATAHSWALLSVRPNVGASSNGGISPPASGRGY